MACQIQLVCSLTDRTLAGKEGLANMEASRMRLRFFFFLQCWTETTNNPINRIRTIPDFLIRASRDTCPLHLSFKHNISIISYLQRRNSRTNLLELSPFNRRALQMSYIQLRSHTIAILLYVHMYQHLSLLVYIQFKGQRIWGKALPAAIWPKFADAYIPGTYNMI